MAKKIRAEADWLSATNPLAMLQWLHMHAKLEPAEVSFWYLVNHLGKRFLKEARGRLGVIEEVSPGVWRSQILRRPLFLIDGRSVPVERETVPLHLVGEESQTIDAALAQVIVEEPGYWEMYGSFLGVLHPNIVEEANRMAATKRKRGGFDLRPFIEKVGMEKFIEVMDVKDVISAVGSKKILKEMGIASILANLSAEDRQKLKEQLK